MLKDSSSKGGNGPERSPASSLFGRLKTSEHDQAIQTSFRYLMIEEKPATIEGLVEELGRIRSHKDLSLEAREAVAHNILEGRKSKKKGMVQALR